MTGGRGDAAAKWDLALDAGVSTRHLSFVETGRSGPSPDLILVAADRLEVPLPAGYAPGTPRLHWARRP